jgi:hypothetical protein
MQTSHFLFYTTDDQSEPRPLAGQSDQQPRKRSTSVTQQIPVPASKVVVDEIEGFPTETGENLTIGMSSVAHVDADEASRAPHHGRRRRRSSSPYLYGDDMLESRFMASPPMASLPVSIVTTSTASGVSSDMDEEEVDAMVDERNSWFNVIVNHSNDSSMENDEQDEEEYGEMALWDGIFWLEACRSISRSVGWFQLLSVVEGVREEAYRAGMWFAVSSSYPPTPPLPHWISSGSTTSWPRSPTPPSPLSPTYSVAPTLIAQ